MSAITYAGIRSPSPAGPASAILCAARPAATFAATSGAGPGSTVARGSRSALPGPAERGRAPGQADLVDVEAVAVLRKRWIAGTISDGRFAAAVEDLRDLPVDRYPALRFMRRAYQLRANVTAYGATYVALAEILNCELWTADQRLANAPGPKCAIRVIQ